MLVDFLLAKNMLPHYPPKNLKLADCILQKFFLNAFLEFVFILQKVDLHSFFGTIASSGQPMLYIFLKN